MTGLVVGLRRSSKALLKAKLAPKNGHGHCLVCCLSDALQLSESTQQIDAIHWKLQCMQPMLVNRKGPNLLHNNAGLHVVQPVLQKLNGLGYDVIHHIYRTSRQPTTTRPSSILTTFCRENYSITSMRQKIVSKSSWNPEAWIFTLQAKMCWL